MKFSDQERRLLQAVQADAAASLASLAAAAGIATSTAWRKVQEFEKTGLDQGAGRPAGPRVGGCPAVRLCDGAVG